MDGHSRPLEVDNVAASDGTLVQGALNGDRAAFAELYDRRARLIRAICFDSTHDLDTAAGLTQEVFPRALQKLRKLRNPQRFAPWLGGIEPAYFGPAVRPGDADAVLLHWMVDEQQWRVISGDLSGETVPAD